MSPVPDDFEQLRRVLALKRHEQPPPGYFYSFSRQVIVRIQAGELGDPVADSFWSFSGGSFLQRIWATLDARPAFAGAFGVAVCGFFIVGALMSDATANPPPSPPAYVAQAIPTVWQQEPNADAQLTPSLVGDTVPDYQPPSGSLFDELKQLQATSPVQSQPARSLRLIAPAHP
jgi:hypothetical protein